MSVNYTLVLEVRKMSFQKFSFNNQDKVFFMDFEIKFLFFLNPSFNDFTFFF